MKKAFALFLNLLLVCMLFIYASSGRKSEAANKEKKPEAAPHRILVKYKKPADLSVLTDVRANIESVYGLQEKKHFRFINLYLYKTSGNVDRLLDRLRSDPEIEYAEPDYVLYPYSTIPNDPEFTNQWGHHNTGQTGGTPDADIDLPGAWDLTTGSNNVIVAVTDTGVDYNHEDLKANMWTNGGEIPGNANDDDNNGYIDDVYGIDAMTGGGDPLDEVGHGTHCAGIIAAVGNNKTGCAGVSWKSKIMAIKIMNESESDVLGYISHAIAGIEYAINNGAHIISNSSGFDGNSEGLEEAIETAKAAGILFVSSAGNYGGGTVACPASCACDNVVAVAAVDENDDLADFSSYHPLEVDVAAPGVNVLSTIPNDDYAYMSGTSASAPYVAGLAALIKSRLPSLNWEEIKTRILKGVDKKPSLSSKVLTEGRINAYNSLTNGGNFTYILTVASKPGNNVPIEVSPSDINNKGNGTTEFQREYAPFTEVTLSAPEIAGVSTFGYWTVNGITKSYDRSITITMDYDKTLEAVYPLYTLVIESMPDTGVNIRISPPDENGDGDGSTNFTRQYTNGTSVNLSAPSVYNGKKFAYWILQDASIFPLGSRIYSKDTSITITIDSDKKLIACYSNQFKWIFNDNTVASHHFQSPAEALDGTIYYGHGRKLYAINPDGTLKWEYAAEESLNVHFISTPVVAVDGTIYEVSVTGVLYAVNPNGTLKWTFDISSQEWSTPSLGNDGTIYYGSEDYHLYALNPDGSLKWKFKTGSFINGSPSIAEDGTIYIGSDDGKLYAVNPDGSEKWHHLYGHRLWSSQAIDSDGTIYFGGKWENVVALNPSGQIKWDTDVNPSPGCIGVAYSTPSIGTEGNIYIGFRNWKLYAINKSTGQVQWEFEAGQYVDSTPAVGADGTIFFGSGDGYFYALKPDGTEKWKIFIGDEIESSPAVSSNGTVYFNTRDGKFLFAVKTDCGGLADTFWPKYHKNNQNTGRYKTDIIQVISPNGGENWTGGTTQTLSWASAGTVGNVKIEYSVNNGGSWTTIAASTANDGSYPWTVPNIDAYQCLVRVSDASSGTPSDISDAVFFIHIPAPPMISLNRTEIFFGAAAGTSTPTQVFFISNSGGGTLNWNITGGASWLNCSPSAGIDTGSVSVLADPSGLPTGTYTTALTISDLDAANSPQVVTVTLHVYEAGSTSEPFGEYATPIEGSTVNSSIPVTGWALDDIGVESVKIYRGEGKNPVYIGDAVFIEGARPDVEQAHPGYPMNYKAGWGYMMLTNFLPDGGNGTFKIHAIVTDAEGRQVTLGTRTIICDNANAVNPFGAIDTPTQGGIASGNSFRNQGWVLTPMPNTIPTDGSSINVFVDSVNLGHPIYNVYRSDIETLFPNYANSGGALAYFDFDTTAYENGIHTIYWTAMDDAGNVDGIGSRYFTTWNESGSRTRGAWSRVQGAWRMAGEADTVSTEPVEIIKGFKREVEPQRKYPDDMGIIRIEIKELERIEIRFAPGSPGELAPVFNCIGYQVVGNQPGPLPVGSTFNPKTGKFYWQPGPGFIGEYRFEFIVESRSAGLNKKIIIIHVEPKFGNPTKPY